MKKFLITLLALIPLTSFGQESAGFFETYLIETVLTLAIFVCLIALAVLVVVLNVVKTLLATQTAEEETTEEAAPSVFEKWWSSINDLKPMDQEAVVMTNHEYDGIRELDNNLPPWWKWMFYVTIAFAVVYLIHFHVLQTGPTSDEEYRQEMVIAEKQIADYKARLLADAGDVEVPVTGPEAILAGKGVYIKFCAACHGNQGQGGIGPNFSDPYWIHGGSMENIISVVENGVPAKGMIAWKNQLSSPEIQQVSAFIYSLEGTNPPNPKAPQGDLFERVEEVPEEEVEQAAMGEPVTMNQ